MTNYGDVTSPRWVGGVNAPASGGGDRLMQIPDEVSFEASAFESDNDAYQYVWDQARKEALKEAANVAAVVVRARGTARQVADAVYDLRNV